ncbi:SRPBCC domain-containing protein [Dyella sp. LX-66]|uniref:SRPBCC family protein n=1 Tax=unclassified Dyella TaxID=2634549 RepID=UPI001BE0C5D7|nr:MULTISPECIES: SRPBCC domain-containing protein [unclassified Dyella]MBT2119635.1 SRPBCC domain-containing protein [Dyella sp. LX-1]MBT2141330.1 SRPBCC domain-containing protein [Dyella sp. LX-66]MBT2142062.1 SRPBCC domain-containing protein [Dyella sp. LX-66]
MPDRIIESVTIEAPPSTVWESLTQPDLMRDWMGEPAMKLEVSADWRIGGAVSVRGVHTGRFENRGKVLAFEPERRLSYTHLSSVSRLPDEPSSYTVLEFRLTPLGEQTRLDFEAHTFPTEVIFRHLAFYWGGTLDAIARQAASRHGREKHA